MHSKRVRWNKAEREETEKKIVSLFDSAAVVSRLVLGGDVFLLQTLTYELVRSPRRGVSDEGFGRTERVERSRGFLRRALWCESGR